MRILAIRGKNLASLEGEFEVDFTTEPLKSAGIFAITGSTGSGKSTLLDAICLALFDNTPRISHAETKVDIVDVKESKINLKDPRTILRRGTSDGYAEVDFVSLAGDNYRARWSVRRAYNKVNGPLQGVDYNVYNLSSGGELQGRKTELLAQVSTLMGLSFEQFTRAVLLAQGDFATFLKANKKDKAELLEKLTGTDIYSRISTKIYDNTQQANKELSLIQERIKGIEILSDEQIEMLTSEKEVTTKEAVTFEGEVKTISEKLLWIQTNEMLLVEVEKAKKELAQSQAAIEDAKPRFDHLKCAESVQEIRDVFRLHENNRKQLASDETSLSTNQSQSELNKKQCIQIEASLKTHQATQEQLTAEWQKLEPQIKEARKLDVQIGSVAKNLSDIGTEVSTATEQKTKCEKDINAYEKAIESINKSQDGITQWFKNNSLYADIVPRIELIISYINDTQSAQKQASTNGRLFHETRGLLEKEAAQLIVQQTEIKRLNEILPAEIAVLRAKLTDNEPCPVCGSIHHPISGVNAESLEEEALNTAKAMVNREIERLTENISNHKGEIIRLQSLIDNYKDQHDVVFAKLTEAMSTIPDWEDRYKNSTLSDDLTTIAKTWNENDAQRKSLAEQLSTKSSELTTLQQRQVELIDNLHEKQNKQATVTFELEQLQNTLQVLLKGKSADEVEQLFQKKLEDADNNVKATTNSLNELIATGKTLEGVISQLTDSTSRLKQEIENLNKNISDWLLNREDELTREQLTQLLAQESSWLTVERTALKALTDAELSAQTKLTERQNRADEHQRSDLKPAEEESKESLTAIKEEKEQYFNQKRERVTEIGVLFANHQKGTERIKQFEKELTDKSLIAENWCKLNDLFGSADGAKFKVLAQGYTLDVLLGYANTHLKDISQRYLLERVASDSLSLQVVDLDMLSEVRSVHSLSGGESFLISLSLALGLSSLSSNRMRVESLFIDEGFGSLDADTLRVAMDALERLQTQGRKIGIISHVAEMTERIPTQIQVIKTVNGKSKIEIKGINR